MLEKYKPFIILETGTNAGIFSWMCSNFLDDFEIHTIDWNPNSKIFIDKIQEYFNKGEIIFYNKKSFKRTLRRFFYNFDSFIFFNFTFIVC